MAIDSVTTAALERIREAIAIQEMASRVSGDHEEDFDMLQRACLVTFRLLEEAAGQLSLQVPG